MGNANTLRFIKRFIIVGLVCMVIGCGASPELAEKSHQTKRVILDTDISSDVDDVGAVSVLHALADQGEIEILAVMVSSGDPWSASCLDALNTYFGRPDIPIGTVRGKAVVHESKYTQKISEAFQHDLGSATQGEDAVLLYRKILASSKDGSVTIVSVGYLTNLSRLLQSSPDGVSDMNGRDLVAQKVVQLVCMGGKYPSGREWNFYQDASAAVHAVAHWPVPITFIGFETGVKILPGSGLKHPTDPNPVRLAYKLYNGLTNRPSWDQLAVLYTAKKGKQAFAEHWEVVTGQNSVDKDGSNRWIDGADRKHAYIRLAKPPAFFAEMIEKLMALPLTPRNE